MARDEIYPISTIRTGINQDGFLELQLIYGNNRGSSLWFQLTKAQAAKLAREIEALRDEPTPRVPLKLAAAD